MATDVILPALGMSQDEGKIVRWLKAEGEHVAKGETLVEIETDKATVEIEAPADGVLAQILASVGDDVPVGQVIAAILTPAEASQENVTQMTMASPKARRLVTEQGKDLAAIKGSGPGGAVLAADVLAVVAQAPHTPVEVAEISPATEKPAAIASTSNELALSNIWRIMAERTRQSWTSVPHIYLVRDVNASRLIAWREQIRKRSIEKVTYTDLLVRIVAEALRLHPRLNALCNEGSIILNEEIHIGLAVAVEEGLVVPVIHQADKLSLSEIAQQRKELIAKAQVGKLRPQDISDGTFTISNLGMYNVDAFNAIINQPQVAILAVGRIAERVIPINGQPVVQPMMVLTLSCDHRAVDGARGAQFLDTLATLVEEPLGLFN